MPAQEHRFILCEALLCELVDEDETEETLVVSKEDGAEVVEHPRIYHGLQRLHAERQQVVLIECAEHYGIVAPLVDVRFHFCRFIDGHLMSIVLIELGVEGTFAPPIAAL